MRTILTYGTFDLLHIGHVRLLERARALGDELSVGVSTDEFNSGKGKHSFIPYEHRADIVQSVRHVTKVVPEMDWNQKETDIVKYNVDVLVMGDDWTGKFDHLNTLCEGHYFPRTSGISTTEIKDVLRPFSSEKIDDLREGLNALQGIIDQLRL